MPGEGPFLWLNEDAPPAGFRKLPPGGMCLSAFLFVRRGREILLGKYRDVAEWEALAGLDPGRVQVHSRGWTIPARQLKFGEDPREAARDIGEHILQMSGMSYSEPRAEVDLYEAKRSPGRMHYDVWFLVDARPREAGLPSPPWYAELAWFDPATVRAESYARGHQDVVARWRHPRIHEGPGPRA